MRVPLATDSGADGQNSWRRGFWVGDKSDPVESGLLCHAHHLDDPAIRYGFVGTQLHFGFRILGADACQVAGQHIARYRLVIQENLARLVHHYQNEFGRVIGGGRVGSGRSSRIELANSGAVMIKITTRTSITSISGVMLMSLMGGAPVLRSSLPKAMWLCGPHACHFPGIGGNR